LLILLLTGLVLCLVVGTAALVYTTLHPVRRTYGHALAQGKPADPADVGLNAQSVEFRFHDGSASPGWLIEGADAAGPVIVVTHGWSSSRIMQIERAAQLRRCASLVVLYDMRGHGDSTASICRLGTTEVDDLLEVLEQVPVGHCPVVLYGSSMGAGISIAAAARPATQPVAAVIAEGPYRYGLEPIAGHLRCMKYPVQPMTGLAGLCLAARLGGFGGFDRAKHASRLACPLLILHGTADRISSIESARQIAAAAAKSELVEFEGADHEHLIELDESRYLWAVERLLVDVGDRRRPAPCPTPSMTTAAISAAM